MPHQQGDFAHRVVDTGTGRLNGHVRLPLFDHLGQIRADTDTKITFEPDRLPHLQPGTAGSSGKGAGKFQALLVQARAG